MIYYIQDGDTIQCPVRPFRLYHFPDQFTDYSWAYPMSIHKEPLSTRDFLTTDYWCTHGPHHRHTDTNPQIIYIYIYIYIYTHITFPFSLALSDRGAAAAAASAASWPPSFSSCLHRSPSTRLLLLLLLLLQLQHRPTAHPTPKSLLQQMEVACTHRTLGGVGKMGISRS